MEDLDMIRKKLKASASNKSEEKRLLGLFEKACSGLGSQTSISVKVELEQVLDDLLEEVEEQARVIKGIIKQ